MPFEVQHNTLRQGWINNWSETTVDKFGKQVRRPQRFKTRRAAETELSQFLADIEQQIRNKERDKTDNYYKEEFRIVEVA